MTTRCPPTDHDWQRDPDPQVRSYYCGTCGEDDLPGSCRLFMAITWETMGVWLFTSQTIAEAVSAMDDVYGCDDLPPCEVHLAELPINNYLHGFDSDLLTLWQRRITTGFIVLKYERKL